ncbi:MAG: hypothetical protein V7K68_11430 [Nostoc sp.]
MQYEVIVASGVAASTPAPVTSSRKTEFTGYIYQNCCHICG